VLGLRWYSSIFGVVGIGHLGKGIAWQDMDRDINAHGSEMGLMTGLKD